MVILPAQGVLLLPATLPVLVAVAAEAVVLPDRAAPPLAGLVPGMDRMRRAMAEAVSVARVVPAAPTVLHPAHAALVARLPLWAVRDPASLLPKPQPTTTGP